jgi:hypothetical protein
MPDLEITRHGTSQAGEYHAHVPGGTAIGRLTWIARGTVRIADARSQHFTIDPQCSYVAAQFDSHPEWADLRASAR